MEETEGENECRGEETKTDHQSMIVKAQSSKGPEQRRVKIIGGRRGLTEQEKEKQMRVSWSRMKKKKWRFG
jgi:hypothetical protein